MRTPSSGLGDVARAILAMVSPRHRRWRRLLRSLTFDPDAVAGPLPAPGRDDFVICGCPRSGTTLAAAQLFQPPRVVTVMEPWDGFRLPPAELFASLRQEIEDTGRLRRGKMDVAALRRHRQVAWTGEGAAAPPVAVEPGWKLGVKWPAYWRLLDRLPRTRFVVCLRDREEVLASFARQGGRLAQGLEYDVPFHRDFNRALLAATDDPVERRERFYDRVDAAVRPHLDRPEVFALPYARWFDDPEGLRRELSDFLDVELGPWPARLRPPAPS